MLDASASSALGQRRSKTLTLDAWQLHRKVAMLHDHQTSLLWTLRTCGTKGPRLPGVLSRLTGPLNGSLCDSPAIPHILRLSTRRLRTVLSMAFAL